MDFTAHGYTRFGTDAAAHSAAARVAEQIRPLRAAAEAAEGARAAAVEAAEAHAEVAAALGLRAAAVVELGLGRIVALYSCVLPPIHFIPYSLKYSVSLFLKRQCDRTLGGAGG